LILLFVLVLGPIAGLSWASWNRYPYKAPNLQYLWLVLTVFLAQVFIIYRSNVPNGLVAACLLVSQILLLGFAWLNRRVVGMPILICGVLLNLLVMAANGGFMPISPHTAGSLISEQRLLDLQLGSRIGTKDILLPLRDIRFEWLADRFLTPAWFPSRVAFSLGDVFIACGVFWMLFKPEPPIQYLTRGTPI
jgi:Family of unknown function (DUF5317)